VCVWHRNTLNLRSVVCETFLLKNMFI
jgi:hypothetical protein